MKCCAVNDCKRCFKLTQTKGPNTLTVQGRKSDGLANVIENIITSPNF